MFPGRLKRGKRVAQVLLIPYTPPEKKGTQKRGTGGFGSTGVAGIFLAEKISGIRPVCQIEIQGKNFKGLLDTGGDVSIISSQEWPAKWQVQELNINIIGVGRASDLRQSVCILPFFGPEGQKGFLQPYVADIAVNLWGRDLLTQWEAEIWIPPGQYSPQSQNRMSHMGCQPGKGLGKFNQRITESVQPSSQQGRGGLEFKSENQEPFM